VSANLDSILVVLEPDVERQPVLDQAARIAAGPGVRLVEGAAVDVLPPWCTANGMDMQVAGVMSRSRPACLTGDHRLK
jgi:hypothetical protein